jgi:anti-sigma regulatory factor (Ser/Thr protein kinase)
MRENEVNSGESVLTLNSESAELERLGEFIDGFCNLEGIPQETCYQLHVALEELVINTIKYGGCEPKEDAIRLSIRKVGAEVSVVLSDSGVDFNPLDAPSPDLTKNLLDRPVGGLGIHLARQLIPSIRYERRGGRNYLFLTKPVKPESGTVSPEEATHANRDGDNQS